MITVYRTEDGSLFESQEQAEQHEEFLKNSDVIEEFLNSALNPYYGPQRVIAKKTIINCNIWNSKNAK